MFLQIYQIKWGYEIGLIIKFVLIYCSIQNYYNMKNLSFLILCVLTFVSCKQVQEPKAQKDEQGQENIYASYTSVGDKFSAEDIFSAEEMSDKFMDLQAGDTITAKFKAEVASVCKKKGCWMNLQLKDGREAAVKFKDYAFFVPNDIEEKEVVVSGKAFVSVVSVEDQRHYAEDAGKAPEEIEAITEPKTTLSFLADGVLIGQ